VASFTDSSPPPGSASGPPTTAAPPLYARVLAIIAIVVAGLSGGLIGYAVTDISCADGCPTQAGLIGLASAIGCAIGVAIVAVLTLRAMAEWNAREAQEQARAERP
jgi:hypothetical protein